MKELDDVRTQLNIRPIATHRELMRKHKAMTYMNRGEYGHSPHFIRWNQVYANVCSMLLEVQGRGYFQMSKRDERLVQTILQEKQITKAQCSWLGHVSLRYLQDGVYESHTWWYRNERNLIMRWRNTLDIVELAAAKTPGTTVREVENIAGSEFMARYQKVLASKI